MSLREKLDNNSAVVTIVAVVVLLLSLIIIVMQMTGGGGRSSNSITEYYYFDMSTGKIVTAPATSFPPVKGADGKESSVRAYIYACGECGSSYTDLTAEELESQGAFIAWLEKYPPKIKKKLQNAGPEAMMELEMMGGGMLVTKVGSKKWVPQQSKTGFKLTQSINTKCPDGRARACFP
ncbi:hypothetical protein [Poriferisphaera sp. WC338]|uniref:hypothetical protein n=1 Tax=Poriferisphaera sp. WC338 TaxID=3425129 RepID=UPI003D81B0A7